MSKSKQKLMGRCFRWLAILVPALMVVCVSSSWPAGAASTPRREEASNNLKTQMRARAFQSASKTATIGFHASLEAKENADFLLTPAILVQEAVREDVIVTYPSE